MRLRSVQVGMPRTVIHEGREVLTGIFKDTVHGPVRLTTLHPVGDGQGDLEHHGGPEKAVNMYPFEHYAHWERVLGRPLPAGAFGENLTLEGMTEDVVHIGDTYRVGSALLQVAQPRIPCYKLSMRNEEPTLAAQVIASGYSGYYFRVLEEGDVQAGDEVVLVSRPEGAVTVAWANKVFHHDRDNRAAAAQLLEVPGLAKVWQRQLRRRLGRE